MSTLGTFTLYTKTISSQDCNGPCTVRRVLERFGDKEGWICLQCAETFTANKCSKCKFKQQKSKRQKYKDSVSERFVYRLSKKTAKYKPCFAFFHHAVKKGCRSIILDQYFTDSERKANKAYGLSQTIIFKYLQIFEDIYRYNQLLLCVTKLR